VRVGLGAYASARVVFGVSPEIARGDACAPRTLPRCQHSELPMRTALTRMLEPLALLSVSLSPKLTAAEAATPRSETEGLNDYST
jgi:hypothetical protein